MYRPVLRWLILGGVILIILLLLLSYRGGVKQAVSNIKLGITTSSSPENRNSAPEQATNILDHKSAATGYTFTGEAIRTFPSEELKFASLMVPSKTEPEEQNWILGVHGGVW